MRSSVITLSLVAVIGVVIGLLLQSPTAPLSTTAKINTAGEPTNITPNPDKTDSDLNLLLQEEILARKSLEKKVATLSLQIAKLSDSHSSSQQTGDKENSSPHSAGASQPKTDKAWFNKQALLNANIEEAEADRLKALFENMEMQKLYLRDRAIREGWSGGKRYRDELKALNNQVDDLEGQLGEEGYSAYLYATGRSNRVEVQSVLSGSPAGTAGIQTGDQIIKYDNERVYNWGTLRKATSKGTVDETVIVEVERDGKELQFYLPRGPLGIRMNSVSVTP